MNTNHPTDWLKRPLEKMTTKIGSGKTPLGGEKVYVSNGILFIRSQNVYPNKLLRDDCKFISRYTHKEMKSSKVLFGDVLLNITGASIGRCCVYKIENTEANVNQHVCIIRGSRAIDSDYLCYYINSWDGQKQIWSFLTIGNREGLNFRQIGMIKPLVPPLPEQKKIAEILSTWDRAIELTEKLIESKEKKKRGLMQQLLTGKKTIPYVQYSQYYKKIR